MQVAQARHVDGDGKGRLRLPAHGQGEHLQGPGRLLEPMHNERAAMAVPAIAARQQW
jgi:hypothetical protein